MTRPEKAGNTEILDQVLPLVLEIIPGQAAEGLIDVFEPGSFEKQPLRKLYEKIDPEGYRELRDRFLGEPPAGPGTGEFSPGDKLGSILFDVLPRFVRRRTGLARTRLGGEGILDLIGLRIRIPPDRFAEAARILDADSARRRLRDLERQETAVAPPGEGPISGGELRDWIRRALAARMAETGKDRLRRVLEHPRSLAMTSPGEIALRLHIAAEGSLEIDGFGFSSIGVADEYVVYKHTGEYALKDYYGRLYLFPDCRVAVSTVAPLRPFVMDVYRHPFLEGDDSEQPICLRDFDPPRVFTGAAVVRALEAGIHALLHGYSSRRRNG